LKDIHLKFAVKQAGSIGFDAIGFNLAAFHDVVDKGQFFDICYIINENEYKGRKNLQLVIKDIKKSESAA
jgi:single-stranded-DNA-specific exonuclease